MATTLKDISKRARTSEATVSLVLNGRHFNRVSLETRHKIESIAREMGYVPRRAAQILATGKTHNIGVILNDLSNPFFGHYASLIQQALLENGYTALPMETQADRQREQELMSWLPQRSVDGIIALENLWEAHDGQQYAHDKLPFVLRHQTDNQSHEGHTHVSVDYQVGITKLASHLKAMRWDNVGVLMPPQHMPHVDEPEHPRTTMIRDALHEHGLQSPQTWWASAEESKILDHWYEQTMYLLREHPQINALIVHNAIAVPAVYAGALQVGRVLGRDLAIAAFDDNLFTPWLRPGVTVIAEPIEQIAKLLVKMLLDQLADPARPVSCESIPTELLIRSSTDRSM
ncbi:MAG: LacI family DNA-binding transcriptional regulator [Phycisphaeraceae bacterium JB051]